MRGISRNLVAFVIFLCSCTTEPILPVLGEVSSEPQKVLFLGDSLTAGYGLKKEQSYPMLIDSFWQTNNLSYRAINAGISGDTTKGVLMRLDPLLTQDVVLVFLAIGANDGLRAYPLNEVRTNLTAIIQKIKEKGIPVVLAGMRVPVGPKLDYPNQFRQIYKDLAKEMEIPLYPFLLKGVAAKPQYNLDGVHPNANGQKIVAQNILKFLNSKWILE